MPAGRPRREQTVYECDDCGQRLAGQRPCRRIDFGGPCPHCGQATTITDLTEAPMT
jgi:DNA-directed RNA polymerase subunit RPC12/RpoP